MRSFSLAAKALSVSPSAISQSIKNLEHRVGAPLFMRTTRSVGLTQAGESFLERVGPTYSNVYDAYEFVRNLGNRPTGRLRINLMRGAVEPLFAPIIAGFCETYPDIELEIYADDALSDLNLGGFDAGVRLGEALEADMIAIRLSTPFRFLAAAAPSYLERYGRPQTPKDLAHHRCIRYRAASLGMTPWNFQADNRFFEVNVTGPVIVNDMNSMVVAMKAGVAIGFVGEPVVKSLVEAGELEFLLTEFATSTSGLFLYYPSRKQVMPKLRAFIDYMQENLPKQWESMGLR